MGVSNLFGVLSRKKQRTPAEGILSSSTSHVQDEEQLDGPSILVTADRVPQARVDQLPINIAQDGELVPVNPVGQELTPMAPTPMPPEPPPKRQRGPHAFDKEHISDTMLSIGSGLLSSSNFSEGLGKAGQGVLAQNQRIRDEQKTTSTFGGPDGTLEYITNGKGEVTVREHEGILAAVGAKAQRERGNAVLDADMLETSNPATREAAAKQYANILALPASEQGAAYRKVQDNLEAFGLAATDFPASGFDPALAKAFVASMSTPLEQATYRDGRTQQGWENAHAERTLKLSDVKSRRTNSPKPKAFETKAPKGLVWE